MTEEARRKKAKYNSSWAKKNWEKITVDLPAGYKEKLKTVADKSGLSKAGFIRNAIDEKMAEIEIEEESNNA